jgi:hypothetical protein
MPAPIRPTAPIIRGKPREWKELTPMGCLKGKKKAKKKPGNYVCKKCGAVDKKKKHICKPNKIKDKD